MEAIQLETGLAPRHQQRILLPHSPLTLHDAADTVQRQQIETFIRQRFAHAYQADIHNFMPYLLNTTADTQINAAIGVSPATEHKLFVEHYADQPIEQILSLATGKSLSRNAIAEVGNLAARSGGASQSLFILITAILHEAGYDWVIFTATQQVSNMLRRLKLKTFELHKADPKRLPDHGASWGNYYSHNPTVVAGKLAESLQALTQREVIRFLLDSYQPQIKAIAKQLR